MVVPRRESPAEERRKWARNARLRRFFSGEARLQAQGCSGGDGGAVGVLRGEVVKKKKGKIHRALIYSAEQ